MASKKNKAILISQFLEQQKQLKMIKDAEPLSQARFDLNIKTPLRDVQIKPSKSLKRKKVQTMRASMER